jgi:hypothetical protein
MTRERLQEGRAWADGKLATGQEPPWATARRRQQLITDAAPLAVIEVPSAASPDLLSVGRRLPMTTMGGSGADTGRRQYGHQSARHESISKKTPVGRFAAKLHVGFLPWRPHVAHCYCSELELFRCNSDTLRFVPSQSGQS